MTGFDLEPPYDLHNLDDVARTQDELAKLLRQQNPGASDEAVTAAAVRANKQYGGLFEAADNGYLERMNIVQIDENGLRLEISRGEQSL
jgi:hypothetical protein